MSEEIKNNLHATSEGAPATAPVTQTSETTDPYAAIVLPENSCLSADTLAAFKQTAAQVHLPAEALQQWLIKEEARVQQLAEQQADAQRAQLAAWARQTQEELGANWQTEVSKAVRVADVFGGPELRELLEKTGLGNHPVIVRTFAGIGQRISEDITAAAVPGAQTDKTFTQALYGKN